MSKLNMDDTACYKLAPVANIAQAETILKDFRELLILGQDIEIDAGAVERIDTSVLQLLVSFKKSLIENQHSLILKNYSDAFVMAADTIGISPYLDIKPSEK